MCERQEANKAVDPTPTFAHRVFQTFSALLVIHAWFDCTRQTLVLGLSGTYPHAHAHHAPFTGSANYRSLHMVNCFQIMT